MENGRDGNGRNDLNILFAWSTHSVDMSTVKVDNNYFVPRNSSDKIINIADARNDYSGDEYMAQNWASSLYTNSPSAGNPMRSTPGSYKILMGHKLDETRTIANGGVGFAHPYLDSVSLPGYVGPCGDGECGWIDEVLALATLGEGGHNKPDSPGGLKLVIPE